MFSTYFVRCAVFFLAIFSCCSFFSTTLYSTLLSRCLFHLLSNMKEKLLNLQRFQDRARGAWRGEASVQVHTSKWACSYNLTDWQEKNLQFKDTTGNRLMSTPRKVNFSATISRSVWIMIKRYWVKYKSSVAVCSEYKYFRLWVLVWLKCCRKTVIFRLREQEEYLFPVFPSPRNLGYVNEEKKYSNCWVGLPVPIEQGQYISWPALWRG